MAYRRSLFCLFLLIFIVSLVLYGCGKASEKEFVIEGKWKNIGDYTYGQVQSGAIVIFDGSHCNVYSPQDTYAFYLEGKEYRLDCTSVLFTETVSFIVKTEDNDHIRIYNGSEYLLLQRVS